MTNKVAKIDEMSLTAIATEINTLYDTVENAYMRTAALLAEAKAQFETPTEFLKWATNHTSFVPRTVQAYIAVNERFKNDTGVAQAKNPIPFKTLRAMSSESVSNKTVRQVVSMHNAKTKAPPTTEEVQRIINKASPKIVPVESVNPDFATRSIRKGEFTAMPSYLLDVTSKASSETIRVLAKYWKQKYHPDKDGGDADIFDRIVKAEASLLAARGEK